MKSNPGKGLLQGAGYFLSDKQHWVVMNPAKGRLLLEILASGSHQHWPECFRRQVVRKLISSIQILHESGYRHGDIKPDNIFIDPENGDVQLIDFSASYRSDAEPHTLSVSPGWQPEWLLEKCISHKADIYGVALIIWCFWTGKHPFETRRGVDFKATPSGWPLKSWRKGVWLKKQLLNPEKIEFQDLLERFG